MNRLLFVCGAKNCTSFYDVCFHCHVAFRFLIVRTALTVAFRFSSLTGGWENTVNGIGKLIKQSSYRMAITEFIAIIVHAVKEIRIY